MDWMTWYNQLAKPSWTPAPAIIGTIWKTRGLSFMNRFQTRSATLFAFCMGCVLLTGCAGRERVNADGRTPGASAVVPLSIERTTFSVGREEFEAVVHRPAASRSNGWGVLLIGGGMGNDLDWTTPGTLLLDGQAQQFSLSGDPHSDAPAISAELADRRFVVVRWSTIAMGDPLRSEWPVKGTPRSHAELLDQARAAMVVLRGVPGVRAGRIVLVGHSLGAARAFTLASGDEGVRAVVALAPAYFTDRTPLPSSFVKFNMRRGQDVVAERGLPVLAVFGSLDRSRVVDAAGARAIAGTGTCPRLEVAIFDGLGHQLGPQEGERHGPIAPEVLERIGDWLERAAKTSAAMVLVT